MKQLSTEEVLAAFDAIGDQYVHVQALRARLEHAGCSPDVVAAAIEEALSEKRLSLDSQGGLRRC